MGGEGVQGRGSFKVIHHDEAKAELGKTKTNNQTKKTLHENTMQEGGDRTKPSPTDPGLGPVNSASMTKM